MSVSLSFDGFNPGFISSLARNPGFQRVRKRFFSCPKTGIWIVRTRHMHYVPAPLALRGFGSGFDSSRAQNPDPQRLRKGVFHARKRVRRQSDTRHAQQ